MGISTDLNDVEVQKHGDGSSDFVLQTMHFKAHAFEYDLRSRSMRDLLDDSSSLVRVESGRRHQDVELSRQEPQRGDIILACLSTTT